MKQDYKKTLRKNKNNLQKKYCTESVLDAEVASGHASKIKNPVGSSCCDVILIHIISTFHCQGVQINRFFLSLSQTSWVFCQSSPEGNISLLNC